MLRIERLAVCVSDARVQVTVLYRVARQARLHQPCRHVGTVVHHIVKPPACPHVAVTVRQTPQFHFLLGCEIEFQLGDSALFVTVTLQVVAGVEAHESTVHCAVDELKRGVEVDE